VCEVHAVHAGDMVVTLSMLFVQPFHHSLLLFLLLTLLHSLDSWDTTIEPNLLRIKLFPAYLLDSIYIYHNDVSVHEHFSLIVEESAVVLDMKVRIQFDKIAVSILSKYSHETDHIVELQIMGVNEWSKDDELITKVSKPIDTFVDGANILEFLFNPDDLVPVKTYVHVVDDVEYIIPKVVYQTWITVDMPERMRYNFDLWRTLNPDYNFVFFDDAQQEEWMINTCQIDGVDYVDAWRSMQLPAAKADLFRYCLLYVSGGVWVDIDMVPIVPLKDFMTHEQYMVLVHDEGMPANLPGFYNAFFATIPRNPILKVAMDIVNFHYNSRELYPVGQCTGPLVLWTAVHQALDGQLPLAPFVGKIGGIEYFLFDTHSISTLGYGVVMLGQYDGYVADVVAHGGMPHFGRTVTWVD
jgi:hypothetical protein